MKINTEEEYHNTELRIEQLIQKGTELGDMELLSDEEKAEFSQLSSLLDDYGIKHHPLPGQMTPILVETIRKKVKEKGLKQKDAANVLGISATTFSDLMHGRRSLSFEIARNLYHNLGIPAEVVLG